MNRRQNCCNSNHFLQTFFHTWRHLFMHPSCMKLSIGIHLDLNGIFSIKRSMYSDTWDEVYLDALFMGISAIIVLLRKQIKFILVKITADFFMRQGPIKWHATHFLQWKALQRMEAWYSKHSWQHFCLATIRQHILNKIDERFRNRFINWNIIVKQKFVVKLNLNVSFKITFRQFFGTFQPWLQGVLQRIAWMPPLLVGLAVFAHIPDHQ